jgi:hypothetical protein
MREICQHKNLLSSEFITFLNIHLRSRIDEAELIRLRETGNVSPTAVAATLGSSPPVPDKFTMRAAQVRTVNLSTTSKSKSRTLGHFRFHFRCDYLHFL